MKCETQDRKKSRHCRNHRRRNCFAIQKLFNWSFEISPRIGHFSFNIDFKITGVISIIWNVLEKFHCINTIYEHFQCLRSWQCSSIISRKNSQDSFPFPFLASNITEGSLSRTQRHLLVSLPRVPVRASWAGGEGYACITSLGILGSCQPFMKCYPYFKSPQQAVRFPVLNAWDSWVLGNRDTCNYYTNDGREAYGVCCLNPINSAPAEVEGNELNKIDFPVQNIQSVQSWPPQIPTHPPDHAAPTHPPSHFGVQPVTERPIGTTTRRATTWATRPPVFGAPGQTTSRRPILIIPTTESPIINDVAFDGGACGGKNGFQVV